MSRVAEYVTLIRETVPFSIMILETGWIEPVYLYILGRKIPAKHIGRQVINGLNYSIFIAPYCFYDAHEFVEACFHYFINGEEYVTEPIEFEVWGE